MLKPPRGFEADGNQDFTAQKNVLERLDADLLERLDADLLDRLAGAWAQAATTAATSTMPG